MENGIWTERNLIRKPISPPSRTQKSIVITDGANSPRSNVELGRPPPLSEQLHDSEMVALGSLPTGVALQSVHEWAYPPLSSPLSSATTL